MLLRRTLILSALAVLLHAATRQPVRADDADQGAKEFVGDLAKRAIGAMTATGISDAERTRNFHRLFIGAVDLPVISKFVLGRHWHAASPEQQRQFLGLFEDMLVQTWSSRFKDAANTVTFQVVDAKPDTDQGIMVESHILRDKQEPVVLLWRLRPSDGGYRVIDLIVAGTSMLFEYREEYAAVIGRNGGNVEGLLAALRAKVAELTMAPAMVAN